MRQYEIPLLRAIIDQEKFESILPCSERQTLAMRAGWDFGRQAILYRLRIEDEHGIRTNILQQAWQEVVQCHPRLRTVFAMGSNADIFQVIVKSHTAAFAHIQFEKLEDLMATVEQEELPRLDPNVPMHILQVFTSGGSAVIRICYSSINIDHTFLAQMQEHLVREYQSLTIERRVVSIQDSRPHYLLGRMREAEPTFMPHLIVISEEKRAMQYINITMPASWGETLLHRCLQDGVSAVNILQAVWLIVLAKYLDVEQPCAGYTVSDDERTYKMEVNAPREFLCTAHITNYAKVDDIIRTLHRQTIEDEIFGHRATSPISYHGKRLYDSIVSWCNRSHESEGSTRTLSLEPVTTTEVTEDNATFHLIYTGASLIGRMRTNCAMDHWFGESIINMFAQSLDFVLKWPSCKVEDLPRCSPRDMAMFQEWNGGHLQKTQNCIHELISKHAQANPDSPAIVAHDGSYSYHELEILTNQLAHKLFTEFAFAPEEKVILALPHSSWAIVAMLAVLKAGAAFVPVDMATPQDRVESIAMKAKARFVITKDVDNSKYVEIGLNTIVLNQAFVDELSPENMSWVNRGTRPDNLAYIIFTSGSTGEPKGCAIEHQSFCSSALIYGPALGLESTSRVLQFASYAFDASLVEVLVGLLCGSCICVPSDDERMNDIGQSARQMEANWAMLTPSLVSRLNIGTATSLKTLVLVGEPLTADVRDAWVNRVTLFGGYGPSEAGPISAVVGPLTTHSSPTNLGFPVANKSWVVDKFNHDQLVPVGAIGELVLEGPSLGRGYIGDDKRTTQVFIESPEWGRVPGTSQMEKRRMYKTGDLVIRCGDGTLQYMGRKDMQVKIRGQRLELGDVETHLRAIMQVDLAVELGTPRGCLGNEKLLVAFLCFGSNSSVCEDLSSVDARVQVHLHTLLGNTNEKLSGKIASYMFPEAYLPIRTIPVNTSGKRDRRKLQQIIASLSKQQILAWGSSRLIGRPLVTDMDWQIARLWAKVLNIETKDLSLDDDFVKRGGDSLAAMRLSNLCKEEGLKLAFRDIYRSSRILGDHVALCMKRATRPITTG